MVTSDDMLPPLLPPVPRQPRCPKCTPHEAHILPCDRLDCVCTAVHPYGGQEDEWVDTTM